MIGEKVTLIQDSDFDKLVKETYGRPYCFQQQNGCRDRGAYDFILPINDPCDEGSVTFEEWLKADPNKKLNNQKYDWELETHWQRDFYPDLEMVVQDLYKKSILEAGKYIINVDW